MASNFRIIRHQNSDNLHLNLVGTFDGGSAMELIHAIEENATWFKRIFVHTCGLSLILPFGRSVFIRKLRVARLRPRQLVFTGNNRQIMYSDRPDIAVIEDEAGFNCAKGMPQTAC